MYNALLKDKIIKKALQSQGVNGLDFDRLKLYRYNTYNKAIMQYNISQKAGLSLFKKSIQEKGGYHV